MNFTRTPYWQILATPWRVMRPWSFSRWLVGLLALVALGSLLMSIWFAGIWFPNLPGLKKSMVVMGIFCVFSLWGIWSAWFLKLNDPIAARIIPHQLRRLRQTTISLWACCVAISSVALGLAFSTGAGVTLLMGLLMAAPLLVTRFIWTTPFSFVIWAVIVFIASTQRLEDATVAAVESAFAMQAYAITVPGFLGLAWLLAMVAMRAGGPAHTAAYARGRTLVLSNKNLSFADLLTDSDQQLEFLRNRPMGFYLQYALRHAERTTANVLRRVDAALTKPEQAVSTCLPLVLLAVAAISGLWFKSEFSATAVLGLLAWVALVMPHLTRSTRLKQSANTQRLMLLLPGMPRGSTLNTMLAGRHLAISFGTWLVVMLVCWIATMNIVRGPWLWNGTFLLLMAVGWLPMLSLAQRNWSADSSSSAGRIVGMLTLFLLGPACALANFVFNVPVAQLVAVVVLGTAFWLAWGWRRLSKLPQAFPMGWVQAAQ